MIFEEGVPGRGIRCYSSFTSFSEYSGSECGLSEALPCFPCTGALARIQVFGKWHNVPRKQATYGDTGLTYTFSGLTLSPKPWVPVLERIRDRVSVVTGQHFNFVLVNR